MRERDQRSEVESHHKYDIPDATHCKLESVPAFLTQGWVKASRLPSKSQPPELAVYEAELDNGAWIQLAVCPHQGTPLESLPEHNIHHIQQSDEIGNGDIGETFIAGDFYIDWRKKRKWTGGDWETVDTEIRVRRRPESPEQTLAIVSGENISGITVNSDGSVDIDEEPSNDTVEVIVVDTVEE
jgi:hypothetical protein